ncbi:MAG: YfjI family protein [Sandaracinaceae bacterium]|nr:YfjI family protein [Sandaracinaceae bacterium]
MSRTINEALRIRVHEALGHPIWSDAPDHEVAEYCDTIPAVVRQLRREGARDAWPDLVPIGRDAPPVPFPVEVLPPWIGDFVIAEARAVQVPLDMPAVFAIGALAAVTGGRLRVRAWDGFVDACNLYMTVAMPPGSIKSPVHRHVTAPIGEGGGADASRRRPSIERARARRAIAEKRLKRAEDAAARAEGAAVDDALAVVDEAVSALAATPVPTLPRLIVDDATPEQLKSLLAAHGGRLAMLSAESSIFGNVASQRYSKVPNVEAVLAAHSGRSPARRPARTRGADRRSTADDLCRCAARRAPGGVR